MTDILGTEAARHRSDAMLRATLGIHQSGRGDVTTVSEPGGWWRATHTPNGPGTLHLWWNQGIVDAEAWGPGAGHLLTLVPGLIGDLDDQPDITPVHPSVVAAQRNHGRLRIGQSRNLFHMMVPTILEQRVTTGEARQSWRAMCQMLGEVAPGPRPLRLPPTAETLANRPYWWFHRLGVERKRADAIRTVARHANLLATFDASGDWYGAYEQLRLLPGIGVWTLGVSLGPALGDPDAFAIGDYWLKHQVCDALAGEARGTDERMIELLEPYAGQRGRVVRWLLSDGWRPQRFGPGKRVLPIASL
jgi:3-methyladenine DNA glycosylase/8-oxoguanine DNA glycosylase